MLTHKKTLYIAKDNADKINYLLLHEPTDEDDCMSGTITNTASFSDNIEMDIKLCGVRFHEDESNLPWTEAVLFENGHEICCTEPSNSYFGEWTLEYKNITYTVDVRIKN